MHLTFSPEFVFMVIIQLITVGIFIGIYKTTINFMQLQIAELKDDMHKYNNVLTRLALAENSIKSAHKRIDEHIEGK